MIDLQTYPLAQLWAFAILVTVSACRPSFNEDSAGTTSGTSGTATTLASDAAATIDGTTEAPTAPTTTTTTTGTSSTATGDETPTTGAEPTSSTNPSGSSGSSGSEGDTPNCNAYCTTIRANCAVLVMGTQQYNHGIDNCLANCQHFPSGTSADLVGNTLGCRLNQAEAAAAEWPLHCVEAGPGGAGTCGDNCEGYCTLALGNCPGAYPDVAGCMAACTAIPDDVKYDMTVNHGDSLACRFHFLVLAAMHPELCQYIGIDSTACSP